MTSDVINRGPGFQIFKGKKFSNYVNKSSILNVPRVATRFTDITTTTTTIILIRIITIRRTTEPIC